MSWGWKPPRDAKVFSESDEYDAEAVLRNAKVGGVHKLECNVITFRRVSTRSKCLYESTIVFDPGLTFDSLFERSCKFTPDVVPIWLERRSKQAPDVLGHDRERSRLSDAPVEFRPEIPFVEMSSMGSSEAERLAWHTTGDHVNFTREWSEVDFFNPSLDEWPRIDKRAGRGFVRLVIDCTVGSESGTCVLV